MSKYYRLLTFQKLQFPVSCYKYQIFKKAPRPWSKKYEQNNIHNSFLESFRTWMTSLIYVHSEFFNPMLLSQYFFKLSNFKDQKEYFRRTIIIKKKSCIYGWWRCIFVSRQLGNIFSSLKEEVEKTGMLPENSFRTKIYNSLFFIDC